MKFTTCIFDMDGVLIDSEPFWRQAEQEIFRLVGINLSEEDGRETMGIRIDEVVEYRYAQHPWNEPSREKIADMIVQRVAELVRQKGIPLPGSREAVDFIKNQGLTVALASSSSHFLINNTLKALGFDQAFSLLHSAENEEYGKPHPAVFINTARELEVDPGQCLVIEDSINGVIAAKAAKMTCIAVPEPCMHDCRQFALADILLNNLQELPQAWSELEKL